MNITILKRDPNAPFDLYAENQPPTLITDDTKKILSKLTWENLDIRGYCHAIKTQEEIPLKKINKLAEYQEHARKTADQYFDTISILINDVYIKASDFVTNFDLQYRKLSSFAENISNNKTEFFTSAQVIYKKIEKVDEACGKLINTLPEFRKSLEKDSRNFKDLIISANDLIDTNKFSIKSLQKEIKELVDRIDYLNKAIPGYASMTALGILGIIVGAVIGGLMIAGSLGTATPAVVAGGIGLIASGTLLGLGSGKSYDFAIEKKQKEKELDKKNKELANLNKEVTVATGIIEQYTPWVKNLDEVCTRQVYSLYTEWNKIKTNFKTLMENIIDSKEKAGNDLKEVLEKTNKKVSEIRETIAEHKESGLISSRITINKELANAVNLPNYFFADSSTNLITVPSDLWLAFVKKNRSVIK